MKKLLKFNNVIAILGVVALLLFLTPCFQVRLYDTEHVLDANLFQVTFGSTFALEAGYKVAFASCGGLIVAFVFLLVALLLSLFRNANKYGTLLALPFFVTSGVLLCASEEMVRQACYNASMGSGLVIYMYGWTVAIGVILFVLAFFCFIDFIMAIAKPKAQEVY